MKTFYGKYRGTVANNFDPLLLGRVQISCPAVLGSGSLSWALPCVPYAGSGVGLFAVPPVGAHIWVEFEAGNPDTPIYTGCFWATGETASLATPPVTPFVKLFKTDGLLLKLDDTPGAGGVTIEAGPPVVTPPASISVTQAGVELTNGIASVSLQGPRVSLNGNALEVI